MIKINVQIDTKLLRRAVAGKLDIEESKLFVRWLTDKKENQDFFEKAKMHYSKTDVDISDFEPAYQDFLHHIIKKQKQTYYTRLKVVASLAILILSGYFLYNTLYSTSPEINELKEFSSIQPVKGNIELMLSDGRQLLLDDKKSTLIPELSGQIKKEENTLDYTSFETSEIEESKPNSIRTPKGKSLKIILSDGSIAWLNAESSISYLVPFEKDERKVIISGQAYFEVTKNAERPFIVETNGVAIQVLGTKFDVNSYNPNEGVYTTLIEGSVDVTNMETGNNVLLNPNQQAFVSSSNEIEVSEVNVDLVIDWKDGHFRFEKEKLASIFEDLNRWYDIDFEFENEKIKDWEFSGYLERYQELNVLLELFEDTRALKFTMKENVLMVGEYKNN